MVVTLHACDVATDAAIVQAIGWDCRILLTVPCCQHELFPKIKNDRMKVMLKHGIIKERFSACSPTASVDSSWKPAAMM